MKTNTNKLIIVIATATPMQVATELGQTIFQVIDTRPNLNDAHLYIIFSDNCLSYSGIENNHIS